MSHEKIRKIRPLFRVNRVYEPRSSMLYRNQLNKWCQRIGIRPIEFEYTQVQHEYEATPIFPRLLEHYPLPNYTSHGASKLKAQKQSMDALRNAPERTNLIRWEFACEGSGFAAIPHVYAEPAPLNDPTVTGRGRSRKAAAEDSARQLLLEGHCLF